MRARWYGSQSTDLGPRPTASELVERQRSALQAGEYLHVVPLSPASLRPVVLPRSSYDELFSAGAALLGLLRRALLGAAPDTPGRLAALGASDWFYPLVTQGPFEEDYATCIARPDVLIGADGPKFVEFNIGSGIGGVVDTALHTAAWIDGFGGPENARFTGPDPLAVRDRLFVRAMRDLGVKPAVAVVGTTRDLKGPDPLRYFTLQLDSLGRSGIEAEFFEPEDLLDGLGAPGALRYGIGLRHFTVPEWRAMDIDLSPVRAALDAGCRLLASQTAYLIANKKVLGWISEGLPWMTDRDREVVDAYLPWTRVTGDRPVRWRGARCALPELLIDEQREFVLKPAIGMSGQGVLIGRDCPPQQWRTAVGEAVAAGDHIAQEWIEPAPYPMEFTDGNGEESYEADILPVFSPFLFDDRPGGCMVRFLPPARHGVVSVHGSRALSSVAFRRR
jgi:hypothetical protein